MLDIPNPEIRTEEQPEPVTPPQPVSEPTDPQTPSNPPEVDPPAGDPPADPIDYKTKFAASTRENQILQAQLEEERKRNTRRELTNEPAESELQAEFPEWEYMSDTEKRLARQSFTATKLASDLARERQEEREKVRWNTDLELAIAKEPALLGKEQAFKEFANMPTHRGAPLEVLTAAFLHKSGSAPTPTPTPAAPGLEPGNGGPRDPIKPKALSAEDLKNLRENDPDGYREYVKTHDISQLEL